MRHLLTATIFALTALPAWAGSGVYWYQGPNGLNEVYETRLQRYEAPPLGWRTPAMAVPTRHASWMVDTVPPFYRHTGAQQTDGWSSNYNAPVTVYSRTVRHVYSRPDNDWDTRRYWNNQRDCACNARISSTPHHPRSAATTPRKVVDLDKESLPYCK